MTNYYLYGIKFKPSDLTDESLIRSESEGANIEVSGNQYMDEVWDSIITPSQFEVIELFFNR